MAGHAVHGSAAGTPDNDAAITVTGNIAGGSGYGIWTEFDGGVLTRINIESTATVGATSGNAIFNADGDSHVIVASGSTVNGAVRLDAGTDDMDLHGGFSSITLLDGGAGFDKLGLFDADTTYDGGNIQNWEVVNLDNSTLAVTGSSLTVGSPADASTGVFLINGSTPNGTLDDFALAGNLSLAAGTTIRGSGDGTGTNAISGSVINAGLISLAGGGAGDIPSIGGNDTGNNGTLRIDTVLGGDSSATDLVQIGGNTSGATNVVVTNIGGTGAPTVEGIKVIDVAGTSNGAFSLVGDYVIAGQQAVVAGAYGYTLQKNGVANPADGDWYLRSQLPPRRSRDSG